MRGLLIIRLKDHSLISDVVQVAARISIVSSAKRGLAGAQVTELAVQRLTAIHFLPNLSSTSGVLECGDNCSRQGSEIRGSLER